MRSSNDVVMPSGQSRGLSRRSVLKAGAHAAWVVPAVQVVGAAPAFAVCSVPLKKNQAAFSFSGTSSWTEQSTNKWVLTLTYTITSNTPCAVTGMSLILNAQHDWGGIQDHSTPGQYNATKVDDHHYPDNSLSDTWSFTPTPSGTNTWQVVMKIQVTDAQRHAGTITLTATAGGYTESTSFNVRAR